MLSKSKLLIGAKGLLRAAGLEVSFSRSALTETNVLRSLFQHHDFNFIVDVGANVGQYGRLVRSCGYRGLILSFEPLADAYRELCSRAAGDRLWRVAPRAAVGAHSGRTAINVAGNSVSSSLLTVNGRHLTAAPTSRSVGTEEIDLVALDDCLEMLTGSAGAGLLKLDTQGYELEALRGAHRMLAGRIKAVQTELSLVELYDGQPLMLDVCNHLRGYGFQLHHIIPGFRDPADGRLLQLDGIFICSARDGPRCHN